MSDDEASPTTASAPASSADSTEKIQTAMQSLCSIVSSLNIKTPAALLSNPDVYSRISALLRKPNSGAGDNNLCRWLYDTFQSGVSELQVLVLRFLPVIAGVYMSRVAERKPQAGFEAVLLALYAHETTSRAGQAVSVTIPDLTQPSVYHESKAAPNKNNGSELTLAVVSPALEPHGTVRSTRRARIVGVALELFYSKIPHVPISSKIDFCEFCKVWAGQDGDMYKELEEGEEVEMEKNKKKKDKDKDKDKNKGKGKGKVEGRVPLPWELLQPVLRILGHCLLGPNNRDPDLFRAATEACRCLFARSMHDVNPKAILPMRSLMRLSISAMGKNPLDPTELPFMDHVVSL
ncbi:Hyccin, partial [Mucuna pruriens]